jgi:hypothetical protein
VKNLLLEAISLRSRSTHPLYSLLFTVIIIGSSASIFLIHFIEVVFNGLCEYQQNSK